MRFAPTPSEAPDPASPAAAAEPVAAPEPPVTVTTPVTVEVRATGPLALVQDAGRPGLAAVGVGRSGAADAGALRRANRLVGNAPGAAALEVLLGGAVLAFPGGGVVALAGAEVPVAVDGVPVPAHQAVRVPPGGVLVAGSASRGLRLYVAVRGGVAVPEVLGSRSADRLAGIGPAPLEPGDVLPVGGAAHEAAQPWPDSPRVWPRAGEPVRLPVLPGPRPEWFAAGALDALGVSPYVVSPASDRVALRLEGAPVVRVEGGELPSEPVVPGAVQVPPDGLPVVFGADHPVTGGYPVVAVLTPGARDAAAQLRPGDRVLLVPGSG
ncbi:biotin-dependent carboxyltransferase [Cellulomonas triticagri]|uniref:Biotin-dependent carboxyltransferase n=1 Tax=Cellulomonas triticagri TaxID=2483352 RepID=A0A3M2J3D5_9CELL|nr:biotin-dependent carboxyltransferase [Cellulomonas triticagri]